MLVPMEGQETIGDAIYVGGNSTARAIYIHMYVY